MCGHIRMLWPTNALIAEGDNEVICTRKLFSGLPTTHYYIQRCAQKKMFDVFPSLQGKKIIEFDDMIFRLYGEELPSYNFCKAAFDIDEATRDLKNGLHLVDKVTVSTDFLKKAFIDNFGYDRVEVIPNMLPRHIYNFGRVQKKVSDIVTPRVVYAGGLTHYGQDGNDTGDFSKPIIEFLRNNIDKIELVFVGTVPWFLEDLKSKIISLPFVSLLQFPRLLRELNADFYLAPLKESVFNKCKSNLKYLEACSMGAVCIGSAFDDSPYSMITPHCKIEHQMTAKNIEYVFWELCKANNWNEIIDHQYDYINSMWLENNIMRYASLLDMERVKI